MQISKKYNLAETFIAKTALECCENGNDNIKHKHIGYYLIDEGLKELLDRLGKSEKTTKLSLTSYVLPIFSLSLLISILYLKFAYNNSPIGFENLFLIITLLITIPIALNLSINIVNRYVLNNIETSFYQKSIFLKGYQRIVKQ
ncbi:hypothetical protein PL321_14175 [Caloramator sp. mosi_1]|uniref:hypothetical protein n=1 Tax=Caloramator sp. mosi_1 TaxID=3023090 RepID=UPI00235E97B3|nr:hypothetical protein [Caloramator sp. mosi_1]WDC83705.1 hypothetical protein PL321_14175 [Caloramator sp. mosi_1]